MAKYRLRDYIGGSSSPGGWTTATASKRFLNVSTSYSTQSVAGQTLDFSALFIRNGTMDISDHDEEVDRFANQAVSLSGTSGSMSLSLRLSSDISYGHLENGRNAYVTPSFVPQIGGSITATNVSVSGMTVTCTLQWSGINPTYGNGHVTYGATYDWKYTIVTDSCASTNTAWDSQGAYYNDHYYSIDLDGQTISDSNSSGTLYLTYKKGVSGPDLAGRYGIFATVEATFYGDYGATPSTLFPPSCNALCQREAYSYSGIYNTSNVPDPTSSVSTGNYAGGIVHVDAEYIGNNQIQYTAYSAYNGSGISGGSFYIWYKFETWSPGYTNYYWKIKVNGKTVTGRYIKINGKTYDCYDGNF